VRTTLKVTIDGAAGTVELSDPIQVDRLPAIGAVWIDNEKIAYAAKSGNTLTGCTRDAAGQGASTPHNAGSTVRQDLSEYYSVIACHGVHSVTEVFAEISSELLRITAGVDIVVANGKTYLRALSQITISPAADALGISDNITYTTTTIQTATLFPISVAPAGGDRQQAIDGNHSTGATAFPLGAGYSSASYGAVQGHRFYIEYSSTAAANATGIAIKVNDAGPYITNVCMGTVGVKQTVSYYVPGGAWDTFLSFSSSNGTNILYETWKTVDYAPNMIRSGSAYRLGGIIGTEVVERFHATVNGCAADSSGEYGANGSVIERPDHVLKHFATVFHGFNVATDINTASFSAAGAMYAAAIAGGYKVGFAIIDKIVPSEFLQQLAAECRSALCYVAGTWYLDYLPDDTMAPVKTIDRTELAGENAQFVFDFTPIDDITNSLAVRFAHDYSALGSESEWLGTASDVEQLSIDKYGRYHQDVDCQFIRTQAMADHVLAFRLLQRKDPLLICTAPVYWEHWDLSLGETFAISHPLYNGYRFFIEQIASSGGVATIQAISWWLPTKILWSDTVQSVSTLSEHQVFNPETMTSTGLTSASVIDTKHDAPPASGWGYAWGTTWGST
jgi:hypothetical protein